MTSRPPERIRWAKRLQPTLLARLYHSDAAGFRDLDLCEEVGSLLFARCETFHLVAAGEVMCPARGCVFAVRRRGVSRCPGRRCGWETDHASYAESIRRNKKEVVRFLDRLSAVDPEGKEDWRRITAATIDARELGRRR